MHIRTYTCIYTHILYIYIQTNISYIYIYIYLYYVCTHGPRRQGLHQPCAPLGVSPALLLVYQKRMLASVCVYARAREKEGEREREGGEGKEGMGGEREGIR